MRIILNILLGLGLIAGYVKYLEYKGIYYPAKDISANPSSFGAPFEDIHITTEDKIGINGWFISNPEANKRFFSFMVMRAI